MSWAVTDHSCAERCLAPPLGYLYCPDLAQNLCATASSVRIDSEKKLDQKYFFIMSKKYFPKNFPTFFGNFLKIFFFFKKKNRRSKMFGKKIFFGVFFPGFFFCEKKCGFCFKKIELIM